MYASDNQESLPNCQNANGANLGDWVWDMSAYVITNLQQNASRQDMFYCPNEYYLYNSANPNAWQAFTQSSAPPYPYIVTGYIWLFPNSQADLAIPDFNVVTKTTMPRVGYNIASTEMITDATIFLSGLSGGRRFVGISAAGGTSVRTAHLNSDNSTPAGGNITFLDGHIEWRKFIQMTNVVNQSGGKPGFIF